MRVVLLLLFPAVAVAQSVRPEDIQVASAAELWFQRSSQEKLGFLEGLCTGFGANPSNLSQSFCGGDSPDLNDKKGRVRRLCGVTFGLRPVEAVGYMNSFYKQRQHIELPNWVAVAAFNDKACGENSVTNVIPVMQKKIECQRNLGNMFFRLSEAARAKQKQYCDSLPDR